MAEKGKLYLIPTTLGDSEIAGVIPQRVVEIIGQLDVFVVENIRTARRYIRFLHAEKSIDNITFYELNKHTEVADVSLFLKDIKAGRDVGMLSEAGNPGIADPGASIVAVAHANNCQVVPLVGPSSILMALIASGMNGQNFAFNGYLPIDAGERSKKLQMLEKRSRAENQSQIFMETPFRNPKMLEDVYKSLQASTRLCIACDISLKSEFIQTKTIGEWKKKSVNLHKRPAIFIIHA